MFKIEKLTFVSTNNEAYDYIFTNGLNYFVSGNNTGKTEFYKLLDFMFGHKLFLNEIDCYKSCVSEIRMVFTYNAASFTLVRTTDIDKNYIFVTEEGQSAEDMLSEEEYRVRLNEIFTTNEQTLRDLRDFAEEDLSFRTFTMFNFLDEKTQGKTQDFLSKCSSLEYSLRVNTILNFIFNKNLKEIKAKEQEIKNLQKQLENMESKKGKSEFILDKINSNLQIISPAVYYTGKNSEEIKELILKIKSMNVEVTATKEKGIADLEVMYNSLSEQIKKYKNEISDVAGIKKYDANRIKLLSLLESLVTSQSELQYLITPIEELLKGLNEGISFSNYILKDETVKKLEKQLDGIKIELKKNNSRFEMYSLAEKEKAVAVVEEYLDSDIAFIDEEEMDKIRKEILQLKKEIRTLQNSDDMAAIDDFSRYITTLYLSLKDIANFVEEDSQKIGFQIKYVKKGNVLQPVKTEEENGTQIERNCYSGSMARHIVIQLCGYSAFLSKLLRENKYPLIPIFVIDHISKAFDNKNCMAIGKIIFNLLQELGEENIQVFMFDSENAESLGIDSKYSKNLVSPEKSGLCPFFKKPKINM